MFVVYGIWIFFLLLIEIITIAKLYAIPGGRMYKQDQLRRSTLFILIYKNNNKNEKKNHLHTPPPPKHTHTHTLRMLLLFIGCLASLQHASVSQGQIREDNSTCCHTEKQTADTTFYLTQSQYTDTQPTSPSTDPIMPGTWQGSHWSASF